MALYNRDMDSRTAIMSGDVSHDLGDTINRILVGSAHK